MKSNKPLSTLVGTVAAALVIITLAAAWAALWFGLALSALWSWFVMPVFDAQAITIAQAYGLMLVARLLTINISEPKSDKTPGQQAARLVYAPPAIAALLLFIGWVLSAWV